MSTVNINAVLQKVMDSPKVGAAMEQRARQIFEKRKGEVIEQFRESNITKEINIGQDAPNISATLGGYGNLFSQMGATGSINYETGEINILNAPPMAEFVYSCLHTAPFSGRKDATYTAKMNNLKAIYGNMPNQKATGQLTIIRR